MATVQSRFDPNRAHVGWAGVRVRKRRNPPATLAQLRNALTDEWKNIPMRTVNALLNSIQRRIRAATAARGGHTRYWFSVWFWFQDLGGSYQWTSITRDLLITNFETWNFCSIHVPFCNHSKIFNKLFQTWMRVRNKIYPAFLFPFSIHTNTYNKLFKTMIKMERCTR